MLHAVSLAVVLAVVWWLLSGFLVPLILALGAGSILSVVWIAHRMDAVDHESHPIHLAVRGIAYFPWLLLEIAKANFDVAKAILAGGDAIRPRLMNVKASQPSEVGRVTYANSITLTPGTVTIGAEDDILESVQCMFDKKHGAVLKQLEKGQPVTVQGKYKGSIIAVRIVDCCLV